MNEKPFIPPPDVVAEIEEQMLRWWIDEGVFSPDYRTAKKMSGLE